MRRDLWSDLFYFIFIIQLAKTCFKKKKISASSVYIYIYTHTHSLSQVIDQLISCLN